MNSARRLPAGSILIGLFTVALCSGCGEDDRTPTAALLAVEHQAALQLQMELPTLPVLAADLGVAEPLRPATDLWISSWGPDAAEAGARRAEANRAAAPILAAVLSVAEIRAQVGKVSLALEMGHALPDESLPVPVREAMDQAEDHRNRALTHLDAGGTEAALAEMLEASDLLQGVSPESVAAGMLIRGEDALRRERESDSYPLENLDRAERLLLGARQALEDGEPLRAIRRSYYACQLLSVEFD